MKSSDFNCPYLSATVAKRFSLPSLLLFSFNSHETVFKMTDYNHILYHWRKNKPLLMNIYVSNFKLYVI